MLTNYNKQHLLSEKIFDKFSGCRSSYRDLAQFFANLYLFFYKSKWLNCNNNNYRAAKKTGDVFGFTDDLFTKNNGNQFESHYNKTRPSELILTKKIFTHREPLF